MSEKIKSGIAAWLESLLPPGGQNQELQPPNDSAVLQLKKNPKSPQKPSKPNKKRTEPNQKSTKITPKKPHAQWLEGIPASPVIKGGMEQSERRMRCGLSPLGAAALWAKPGTASRLPLPFSGVFFRG